MGARCICEPGLECKKTGFFSHKCKYPSFHSFHQHPLLRKYYQLSHDWIIYMKGYFFFVERSIIIFFAKAFSFFLIFFVVGRKTKEIANFANFAYFWSGKANIFTVENNTQVKSLLLVCLEFFKSCFTLKNILPNHSSKQYFLAQLIQYVHCNNGKVCYFVTFAYEQHTQAFLKESSKRRQWLKSEIFSFFDP